VAKRAYSSLSFSETKTWERIFIPDNEYWEFVGKWTQILTDILRISPLSIAPEGWLKLQEEKWDNLYKPKTEEEIQAYKDRIKNLPGIQKEEKQKKKTKKEIAMLDANATELSLF